MPFIERAGAPSLYYEIDDFTDPWRDAPYLVLQHGYGRNSRFWYRWVPYLSRFYRVVRPDMRGFGQSTRGGNASPSFRLDDLVQDVIAVVDDLGAQSVHYCGEAFGGTLGMQLAATYPDRVRTLNLISAPVYLHQNIQGNYALGEASWVDALRKHGIRKWAQATNTISRFPPEAGAEFLEWYNEELAKTDLDTLVNFSRLCSSYDQRQYLSRIVAPVLGIYPRTRQEQVVLLEEHVKRLNVVRMETDFYMFYCVFPRACAQTVLNFAAQHDGIACSE
jgi:3-oxoadipate enol-lactonase